MRLHWFLPSLTGAEESAGRPGLIRRILQMVGPTWAASPIRRLIQTLALLAFFWLFLYVCWPYTAKPALAWHNWLPAEVDVETGQLTVVTEQPPGSPLLPGTPVHVSDTSLEQDQYLGLFRVGRAGEQELALEPIEPLSREQLDRLSISFGPWTLSERKPGSWPSHYTADFHAKEKLAAEMFLILDPLASISAAVAARSWVWSLSAAGTILLVCLFIPRGFCAYVCPLGTLVDLFDWAIGKRLPRLRVAAGGWWVHVKYYLLVATLAGSLLGVLLSGFVAAIPVVTRALAFVLTPLATGMARDWHQIPSMGPGHVVSLVLFCLILGLGLLGPRFWCKYVCPTGAVFSVGNLFRLFQRKVEPTCIDCRRCVKICPFDAIKPDFTTRTADCTFCQSCGGVCPTRSIKFVGRWNRVGKGVGKGDRSNLSEGGTGVSPVLGAATLYRPEFSTGDTPVPCHPATGETAWPRRGFLAAVAGVVTGAAGGLGLAAAARLWGAERDGANTRAIVRPPGSVPEKAFLALCVRCGECFQACPNDVLQPVGFEGGFEGLWTPQVVADWSGCEPSCSNCGQVCPTGAIRALPLEEKRVARMGLAVVDQETCLPYAGREDCQLCVDECATAGYQAMEFIRTGTEMDPFGQPIEGTGFLAPVVLAEKCVGCGLCQTRCYAINSKAKGLLAESAIRVEAGEGKEDRLIRGSYIALRREEKRKRELKQRQLLNESGAEEKYLPGFLQ